MDVLVTGSHGFIGSALLPALRAAGHRPIRAVRRGSGAARDGDPAKGEVVQWDPEGGTIDLRALDGVDAVVNLAGAGIGDRRWTAARKRELVESRVRGTEVLAGAIAACTRPPRVLVSASAIGIYGDRGDEVLTEASPAGAGFLPDLCRAWEAATAPAGEAGTRVVTIRSGLVLGRDGGVLAQLLLPYRLGLGGRTGSGRQWMSWISLTDEVGAILRALELESLHGPVNLTAPAPVTNRELATTLARVLHRPAVLPTPLPVLRLRYGREVVGLLLEGQRVLPAVLSATGYEFADPGLEAALRRILHRS